MMQHADREIRDKTLVKAILDLCSVINVGMFYGEYPYVVPLNFGYTYEEDLRFYTHHALKGLKTDLIEKNPKVCVVTHVFADHVNNPKDHTNHDYRSVMAFGEMSEIEPGTPEYKTALTTLMECNGRRAADGFVNQDHSDKMRVYRIVCDPKDVTGKAQNPVHTLEEIPLPTEPG